jgi:hypothetical protein
MSEQINLQVSDRVVNQATHAGHVATSLTRGNNAMGV